MAHDLMFVMEHKSHHSILLHHHFAIQDPISNKKQILTIKNKIQ
jgi:hypothetical protein